eukprot:3166243-Amphidinium_carterae.1
MVAVLQSTCSHAWQAGSIRGSEAPCLVNPPLGPMVPLPHHAALCDPGPPWLSSVPEPPMSRLRHADVSTQRYGDTLPKIGKLMQRISSQRHRNTFDLDTGIRLAMLHS